MACAGDGWHHLLRKAQSRVILQSPPIMQDTLMSDRHRYHHQEGELVEHAVLDHERSVIDHTEYFLLLDTTKGGEVQPQDSGVHLSGDVQKPAHAVAAAAQQPAVLQDQTNLFASLEPRANDEPSEKQRSPQDAGDILPLKHAHARRDACAQAGVPEHPAHDDKVQREVQPEHERAVMKNTTVQPSLFCKLGWTVVFFMTARS